MYKKVYFKLLRRRSDNTLWSYVKNPLTSIEYKVGERMVGISNSGLFVFNEFEDALREFEASKGFVSIQDSLEIWAVTVENVRPIKYVLNSFDKHTFSTNFDEYWRGKLTDADSLYTPPQGTLICDSLTLLRQYA